MFSFMVNCPGTCITSGLSSEPPQPASSAVCLQNKGTERVFLLRLLVVYSVQIISSSTDLPRMDAKKELEEKLREVACIGDEDAVHTLVDKGVNVNAQHAINGW